MTTRRRFHANLRPVLGSMFQPTGFPDIGAAEFTRFDGDKEVKSLLVESVQSMANRLEATAWDTPGKEPVAAVGGLPYIRVVRVGTDEFLTSSRLEPHRVFSAYIQDSVWDGERGDRELIRRLGIAAETPLDYPSMCREIMRLDPFSVLHGVFFAGKTKPVKGRSAWPAQPKFTRAISGVVEAHHVVRAISGGRKSDLVRHALGEDDGESSGTAEGYGSVPFHRTEWTAKAIRASFIVDTELLRSYGLPQPVTELLETLALWEIRALLDGGMRLRTACDLELAGGIDGDLPGADELTTRLAELIPQGREVFGDGGPLTVEWSGKKA